MDIAAIGSAIATRFSSASLTAPSGYTTVQKSTSKRVWNPGKLPMVVVSWVGLRDLTYGYGHREGVADFVATFYYSKAADDEATDAALQAWSDVLVDRLLGQIQLGEGGTPNEVRGAYVRSVTPGQERLGDAELAVLEIAIEVEFEHDVSGSLAV